MTEKKKPGQRTDAEVEKMLRDAARKPGDENAEELGIPAPTVVPRPTEISTDIDTFKPKKDGKQPPAPPAK